jgi:hypothetical protein
MEMILILLCVKRMIHFDFELIDAYSFLLSMIRQVRQMLPYILGKRKQAHGLMHAS